ncbi:AraD1 family protein [Aidingimonas halophila]|uniref:Sugar transporter n=1 Tax=Aidingimonas halophila TaxID=574349 RepID=A0A1H3HSP2_9GAMM|nr:AraD1 family protein [Aidingimonas halophila]GHC38947.1 hypothetical protein GCM10008094_35520 [Aidingimonas halophila]SDY18452.1 hypothetical protein SAMN05443545_1137 [Aidingimonas halophila]
MDNLHLVQVSNDHGEPVAARVMGGSLQLLEKSLYQIASMAANNGLSLHELIDQHTTKTTLDYEKAIHDRRILPPITHPDPSHLLLSGTGLTHLGSAAPRHNMHDNSSGDETEQKSTTDTQRMFELGLQSGKPPAGQAGVQPEWFYKGTGHNLKSPYQALELPDFALDGGEEAELAGIYIINDSGRVFRIGYTLGNEFSDHVTEKKNYLYLAHSKLRDCSIGPEIIIGDLPEEVTGHISIHRSGDIIWSRDFTSGEKHMCHSFSNLEYHHFKYAQFRIPGQIHVHFFGAATLSFADGIHLQTGDKIKISSSMTTYPLENSLYKTATSFPSVETL